MLSKKLIYRDWNWVGNRKVEEKKKEKETREIFSASKMTKPPTTGVEPKMTKFSNEKEKEKKLTGSPMKKDLKKI